MSEEFNEESRQPYQRLFPLHYWLAILLVAGVFSYIVVPRQPPFVNPKLAAESYVWPHDCDKREYRRSDYIKKSCMSSMYLISEWKQYGWVYRPGSLKNFNGYYRVKNDAIKFTFCDQKLKNKCLVGDVINDVFVVAGENK